MTDPSAEHGALGCTVNVKDEKGVGRCACSLVTASGGRCKMFPDRVLPPGPNRNGGAS